MTEEIQQVPQEQPMSPAPKRNWMLLATGIVVGMVVVAVAWIAFTVSQQEPEIETPVTQLEVTESADKMFTEEDVQNRVVNNFNHAATELKIGLYTFVIEQTIDESNEYQTHYDLIRINAEGIEELIYRGVLSPGHSATWEYHDGFLQFSHSGSPGEAFVDWTRIIFDENGEQVIGIAYRIPDSFISLEADTATVSYSIDLVTSGGCTRDGAVYEDGQLIIPETTLIGLDLWTGAAGPTLELPEPVTVPCGTTYGENISEPHISVEDFNQDGILIALPDGTEAWISIEDGQLTGIYR